jgi:uncharacterized protein
MGHEIPRHWRLKQERYNLIGEVCPHCDYKIFPPKDVCPNCRGEAKTRFTFSGKGTVWSFTTIYEAPTDFVDKVPYTVALVKLDEGPVITAGLTDIAPELVKIGMPVEMVTRILSDPDPGRGVINYGYRFRPLLRAQIPEPPRRH